MRAPRVKRVHTPFRTASGAIRIGGAAFGVASEITDADGVLWSLITAMDGVRPPEQVAEHVHREFPQHSVDALTAAIGGLVATGYFEDGAVAADVDPERRERYSRSVAYYSYIDRAPRSSPWDVQDLIGAAHVAVLGVGGVGAACAYSLAASGIGRLTLIDNDVVESSNLNRQLLYLPEDIGKPKVHAAAARIGLLRPDCPIEARQVAVDSEEGVRALFAEVDLVVLGADTPDQIDNWCNRAALATGTPWVNGGYDGPHVCLTLYVPGAGPCWRCLRLSSHYEGESTAGPGPLMHMVTAATANLTGQFAAHIALAQLTGVSPPPVGEPVVWNTVRLGHAFTVPVAHRPDCPDCGGPR
ncbi:ThiF family adenylyltransferase [Longispora sp. NPDC051575]|uniref:HesA/MoeB/ThiF family protein n=1 Tax=Longispora sp. NPDC051575 TaxID=3154943 RepID=UPI00341BEB62